MEKRFERNIPAISEAEQALLKTRHAAIIGCGGLGGYIIEFLARCGIGALTVVDGDCFDETNLNRQTLALPGLVGCGKSEAAEKRINAIDPGIKVRRVDEFFTAENAEEILADVDIVMDALDNIASRLVLEDECAKRGLSLVHGAIQGWMAQVCIVRPGSGMLHSYYGKATGHGSKSVLPHVPPFCAAMQSGEAIKHLCGRKTDIEGKLLIADLQAMEFFNMEI